MRIVGGSFRGRVLADVGKGDSAAHLRPTTDRVRENIFNILTGGRFGDPITNARVLDLFAGTGALGLEAISRGAAHATFIDDGDAAMALIKKNVALCKAEGVTRIFRGNATQLGIHADKPFDLVFLDPPYGRNLGTKALDAALIGGWVANNALIVLEEGSAVSAPANFAILDRRRYGDTHVSFLKVEASA